MSDKPTDPSGGSVLDILPKDSVILAGTKNATSVERAGQVILNYLCEKYRTSGVNQPVEWRGLWEKLGIAEEVYGKALNHIVNSIDVELVAGHDHIRLGPGGRLRSDMK